MADRILVTGATGFLGSFVVPLLTERSSAVSCLVRPTSNVGSLERLGLDLRVADLNDAAAVRRALAGVDTLVNLASLGFGHAPTIVEAALGAGVRRAVFISTTGIFTRLPAPSRTTRLEAEALIRSSELAQTILRPTMIYGAARDRNIARLIHYLRRFPVLVVPGSGAARQQPVYVADVARAIVATLERPATIGRAYNIAGAAPLSFNELVDTTAAALGRRVWRLHVPLQPVALAVRVAGALRLGPRISAEQILRLAEDKAFDIGPARRDLGYQPLSFAEGVRREVAALLETDEAAAVSSTPSAAWLAPHRDGAGRRRGD